MGGANTHKRTLIVAAPSPSFAPDAACVMHHYLTIVPPSPNNGRCWPSSAASPPHVFDANTGMRRQHVDSMYVFAMWLRGGVALLAVTARGGGGDDVVMSYLFGHERDTTPPRHSTYLFTHIHTNAHSSSLLLLLLIRASSCDG